MLLLFCCLIKFELHQLAAVSLLVIEDAWRIVITLAPADELAPAATGSATGSDPDSATPGAYGVLVIYGFEFVVVVVTIIVVEDCNCCGFDVIIIYDCCEVENYELAAIRYRLLVALTWFCT